MNAELVTAATGTPPLAALAPADDPTQALAAGQETVT